MFFFDLYGKLAFLFALLFCVGLVLIACVIYYSVANYPKKRLEDGTPDEHADPGVPLVLKGLYAGIALYILIATYFIATRGLAI